MNDVRDMTVRDLCALAEEIRSSPIGSRKLRRAADRMAQVAWALSGGALQQMVWWEPSTMPEPPPDGQDGPEPPPSGRKADVVVMPLHGTTDSTALRRPATEPDRWVGA
jgi:hypothetical protein